ncbi:tRNA (uracil-5-)-methyltransferase homolog B-like isoform X1 [Centruroides vittatus]|uniref:tRNA (uracil-5-)-methyltransferase homolog B-like isoform X1 n=1 Tax=Centruroides vittatus TaxID=120091 RepID=UPI00350F0BB6
MAALRNVTCFNNSFQKLVPSFMKNDVRWLRSSRSSVVTVRKLKIKQKESLISNVKELKKKSVSEKKTETLLPKEKIRKDYKIQVTVENQYRRLAETVTPLWKVPYEKQLKVKYDLCVKKLNSIARLMRQNNCKNIPSHGLPCPIKAIKSSPVIDNYRNKDEFSIRSSPDGNMKTIGFFIGSPAEYKNVVCVSPDYLSNIKQSHKKVVQHLQNYINDSALDACIDLKSGHWKNLVVRSNIHDNLMAIIVMHPQNLSSEELENEKNKLRTYFTIGEGKECNLKSLYFQACPHTRCTHEQAPFELIYGEPYIVENVDDLKFRISPESFFQVNTAAAKVLFNTILELGNFSENSTVLDVCCGTGAISLFIANNVRRTIGIESSSQAIEDALANAELNDIKNSTFFMKNAEAFLPSLLSELYAEDLIVVLNPSRGGLKNSVIKTLRDCKHLKKIIYVSCKPEGQAAENILQLCKPPKRFEKATHPFTPVLAVPVDLFPHTKHCELVIVLQRV